ncbi:MAG TPA: DUF167 family protein [Acidimicrobiales bacterium]|nr:DUF167 family protein [Acidimicrobiales bacterium]
MRPYSTAVVEDLFDVSEDGSVVLRLHVQPRAGRSAVVGRHGNALKVRVAAPPEGGRANAACLALLASSVGVPESQLELVSGASSRMKQVRIIGTTGDEVRARLRRVVAAEASPRGNEKGRRGVV